VVRNVLFLIVSSLLFYILKKKRKLCRREDLLKSLYVLMMSIMCAVYSIICDLGPEIKLITRNRSRSGVRATLKQLQVKFRYLVFSF